MEDYATIATLENVVEAQLLEEVLNERNIPHAIRSFQDPVFDGVFQLQQGWGCVTAPPDYRAMISYILAELRRGGAG